MAQAQRSSRRRRCRFCRELFLPDPRLKARQIACSAIECQKQRKASNQRRWLARHPEYFSGRYYNTRTWRKAHPTYQAEYRRAHPEVARRDNDQRRERRLLATKACAEIQDSISLQPKVTKALKPYLIGKQGAGIQDSILPQVVLISIFSANYAGGLTRRDTRLDRPTDDAAIPSSA